MDRVRDAKWWWTLSGERHQLRNLIIHCPISTETEQKITDMSIYNHITYTTCHLIQYIKILFKNLFKISYDSTYCIRTANTKYYTKHSDQVWCPIILPGLVVYWLNGQKYIDIISFYFTRTQNKNCNCIVVYQVLLATQVWPKIYSSILFLYW